MNIQLKLGDCIKLMNDIEDNSIDLILCDLPFQKTKNKWDKIIPFEESGNILYNIMRSGCNASNIRR